MNICIPNMNSYLPIVIECSRYVYNYWDDNVLIIKSKSVKANLNATIINKIGEIMAEIHNEYYEDNTIINSFDDFCDMFWENNKFNSSGYGNIFYVEYFYNNEWITWNIESNKEKIFTTYNDFLQNKRKINNKTYEIIK